MKRQVKDIQAAAAEETSPMLASNPDPLSPTGAGV
jgi:hypothetical protein